GHAGGARGVGHALSLANDCSVSKRWASTDGATDKGSPATRQTSARHPAALAHRPPQNGKRAPQWLAGSPQNEVRAPRRWLIGPRKPSVRTAALAVKPPQNGVCAGVCPCTPRFAYFSFSPPLFRGRGRGWGSPLFTLPLPAPVQSLLCRPTPTAPLPPPF